VGADGQSSLQAQIAVKVLEQCREEVEASGKKIPETPLTPFRELHELVGRLKGIVDEQNLYDYVHEAISEVTQCGIRHPRTHPSVVGDRGFSAIRDADAGRSVGPEPSPAPVGAGNRSFAQSAYQRGKGLPRDWKGRAGEAYLLYLFGKARSAPMFAIHDEDVLEYTNNIITRGSQVPAGFLDELQQRICCW